MNIHIYAGGPGFGRNGRGLFSCLNRLLSMSVKHIEQDRLFFDLRSSTYCSTKGANALDTLFTQEEIDCEEKRTKGPDLIKNLPKLQAAYAAFFKPIIRPDINLLINDFKDRNFGPNTLGVHVRSTDRKGDPKYGARWSRLSAEVLVREVESHLKEGGYDKIFIATDYIKYREALQQEFGELVCFFAQNISTKETASIHHNTQFNKEQNMREAFVDCILLSQCDFLLRTMSNLTFFSLAANPSLKFLDLSIKYNSYKAREEEWLSLLP